MLYTQLKHKISEIKDLTNLGLISPTWVRNIEIFEEFHKLRNKNVCVLCAYEFVAEDYNISWQSVRKVVYDLSKA